MWIHDGLPGIVNCMHNRNPEWQAGVPTAAVLAAPTSEFVAARWCSGLGCGGKGEEEEGVK
jgi:hypothetical protein